MIKKWQTTSDAFPGKPTIVALKSDLLYILLASENTTLTGKLSGRISKRENFSITSLSGEKTGLISFLRLHSFQFI